MQVKFSDGVILKYDRDDLVEMLDLFEHWYDLVSKGGRLFTRAKAREQIVAAHRKHLIKQKAQKAAKSKATGAKSKKSKEIDLTVDSDDEEGQIRAAFTINHMTKQKCVEYAKQTGIDTHGTRKELRERIAKHHCIDLTNTKSNKPKEETAKHEATWAPKRVKTKRRPFTGQDFNVKSLEANLPGFKDGKCPDPWECWEFFFTDEMIDLGVKCTNQYPKYLNSCLVRPPWVNSKMPWPPKWTSHPVKFDRKTFKEQMMVLYLLGLKQKRRSRLRPMFGSDEVLSEPWLKQWTTRITFEAFLRQLHFEDSADPRGVKFVGSVDYRPNGVPKVGLLLELGRQRYLLFMPDDDCSYDEATARYGGSMTKLKHLQSKYKPYDGVRVYCLNGSKTSYTANFRVDLRDGASKEDQMSSVIAPFKDKGYTVWGDNAFVSVKMLRVCKEWGINFAGTTRTTFGFPKQLVDKSLEPGEWRWLMTKDGLLAAYWSDVGFVKLMSNFHEPDGGIVYRRVSGQADKQERDAPTLGVNYNEYMGGTDLMDWLRGLYTTARIGKKWWKCLFFWVVDTSMINAFILHGWCWQHFFPGKKNPLTLAKFIRKVCQHYKPAVACLTHQKHPRYTASRKKPASGEDTYRGPHGEDRRPHPSLHCPGNCAMERTDRYTTGKKTGLHKQGRCRYCWNAFGVKKRRVSSSFRCSLCKVILCRQCMGLYHTWLKT